MNKAGNFIFPQHSPDKAYSDFSQYFKEFRQSSVVTCQSSVVSRQSHKDQRGVIGEYCNFVTSEIEIKQTSDSMAKCEMHSCNWYLCSSDLMDLGPHHPVVRISRCGRGMTRSHAADARD